MRGIHSTTHPRSTRWPLASTPTSRSRTTPAQALEFYQDVFGGDLTVSTFGEYGDPSQPGADGIMHGQLETPSGYTIMAADTPPGMDHNPGSNIAVSLSGDDADELHGYWDKLAAGGQVPGAAREADVGRRVRHVRRPVRDRLDGQHRRHPPASRTG